MGDYLGVFVVDMSNLPFSTRLWLSSLPSPFVLTAKSWNLLAGAVARKIWDLRPGA